MSKTAANKRAAPAERPSGKAPPAKAAKPRAAASSKVVPDPAPTRANGALKAAMQAHSGIERKPPKAPGEDEPPIAIGKGRKGRKAIVVYLHPFAKDQLDQIALKQKRTVQDLGVEAVNLLFRSYGEKPIA
jgi:hypothetical protein